MTDPDDTLALSGLRRLVLHARDSLVATRPVPRWTYSSDAWQPAQVQHDDAHLLAEEVLTLVAECIPGGERLSADEADRRVARVAADHEKRERKLQAELGQVREQVTKMTGQMELLTAERDDAKEDANMSSAIEADVSGRLAEAERLAKTDVPAAIRYLLGEKTPAPQPQ